MARASRTTEQRRIGGVGGRRRSAFTLIEVLVAIGAIAVVSVGMAAIFDSIGKTVSGGRRASTLNSYAQLLERQFARDFSMMTREGFMVVRQQAVDINRDGLVDVDAAGPANPDNVELFRDQPKRDQRTRRIDELMYFMKGKFESVRRPLFPTVVASANEARIYYGMGQPRVPRFKTDVDPNAASEAQATVFQRPQADDANGVDAGTGGDNRTIARLGRRAGTDPEAPADNPARFASDWILLRHVTLLAQPNATRFEPVSSREFFNATPASPGGGLSTPEVVEWMQRDSDYQIAHQPAAATLFRSLNRVVPRYYQLREKLYTTYNFAASSFTVNPNPLALGSYGPPQFSSGLVDIATTDLQEIRRTIEQCTDPASADPTERPRMPSYFTQPSVRASLTSLPTGFGVPAPLYAAAAGSIGPANPAGLASVPTVLDAVHAWMADAMPTESRQDIKSYPSRYRTLEERLDTPGVRMRCEPASPDINGAMSYRINDTTPAGNTQLDRAVMLNNQFMLAASNLLPRCSEFIVDWSCGKTDRKGQVIWHGLPRKTTVNGTDQWITRPYPYAPDAADTNDYALVRQVPVDELIDPVNPGRGLKSASLRTPARLLYGLTPPRTTQLACLTSYFGYSDPMYPDLNGSGTVRATGTDNPGVDGIEGYPVPWPWPRMVRITVTMADAVDPSVETTFQFVFQTPDASVGVE